MNSQTDKNKLILEPGGVVVLHPGLEIKNISEDMVITVELPSTMITEKIKDKTYDR